MVFESQSKTICLMNQGQRGTSIFLTPNPGIVPRKWRCGLEKRFRWRRLRWGWGSQTFEFLSDGKAVTFWEWEEPKPRAPTAFMKTKLSSASAASRRRATSSGLGTIGQDSEIPRGR